MNYVEDYYCEKCERAMVLDVNMNSFLRIEIKKRSKYPGKRKVSLLCRCGANYKIADHNLKNFLYELKGKRNTAIINRKSKKRKSGKMYDSDKVKEEIIKADESINRWNKTYKNSTHYRLPGSFGSKQ